MIINKPDGRLYISIYFTYPLLCKALHNKGKIENVVKYIKGNFLYNRPFTNIDLLNQEAQAWLWRTANELPHGFTQKRPVTEWEREKTFLRPIHSLVLLPQQEKPYSVRKDNSISYKGNLYSLPYDSYKGRGTKVLLAAKNNVLTISNLQHQELCRHLICDGVGKKVINNGHRRDKNLGIRELEDQFCSLVNDQEKARLLISAIRKDKPRYVRDQLLILIQVARSTSGELLCEALDYCCQHNIVGAADFKAIVAHLQRSHIEEDIPLKLGRNPLNNQLPDQALIQPVTSSINDYNLF